MELLGWAEGMRFLRTWSLVLAFVGAVQVDAVAQRDATASATCTITIPADGGMQRVNHMIRGCHSDSGYSHQTRGLLSELVYGTAFEKVQDPPASSAAGVQLNSWLGTGEARLDDHDPEPLVAGATALLLTQPGDSAINRGFANEGLYLLGGADYDGYLVVKSSGAVTIRAALQRLDGTALAETDLDFSGGAWTKVDFGLVPSATTDCEGIDVITALSAGIPCPVNGTYDGKAAMSDRTAHICIRCGGQVALTLIRGREAHVGFASLQPGRWGRFKDLPVRRDAAEAILSMGVAVVRQGGSFASSQPQMDWRRWRGPLWRRPSAVNGNWGHSSMSGWGMFEMIDFANALQIVPIITLYCGLELDAYADLVEYCWGNSSTLWGGRRVADGHPLPYNVTHFEIGNEESNLRFVDQARVMEEKAVQLGMGRTFYYYYSNGWGALFPNASLAHQGQMLGLGEHLVWDVHTSAAEGVSIAEAFFAKESYRGWSAMNLETNFGDHTVGRMLAEARDLNMFMTTSNRRLKGRTASFCMERSGYNEGGLNDQGLAFFLPNMTWLQPPGYVHAMVAETWQPVARRFNLSDDCASLGPGSVSVQASADGRTFVVRFVNSLPEEKGLLLDFGGQHRKISMTTISSSSLHGANTPASPRHIAPVSAPQPFSVDEKVTVPGYSFSVLVAELVASDAPVGDVLSV